MDPLEEGLSEEAMMQVHAHGGARKRDMAELVAEAAAR